MDAVTRRSAYLKVSSIKVGPRHRKDLGDVASLAKSIAELGLLHPIVVTPQNRLVAGRRRLEAVKRLGWKEVPVRVIDLDHIVQGELAENSIRKNFAPSETVAIANALVSVLATPVGRPKKMPVNYRDIAQGDTRDKVAAYCGVSGRTLEKARAVVEELRKGKLPLVGKGRNRDAREHHAQSPGVLWKADLLLFAAADRPRCETIQHSMSGIPYRSSDK